MGDRIKKVIENFRICHTVTGSVIQSIRFALSVNNKNSFRLHLRSGIPITLRKSKADKDVFKDTFFSKYHRSPVQLGKSPYIIDLGCNIGLTLIDFLQEYPDAKITGVEMNEENYNLSVLNTKKFANVLLIHKAVWSEERKLFYDGYDAQSFTVNTTLTEGLSVESISMNSILNKIPGKIADFVKMDIEGAEYVLLLESKELSWLRNIKYLSVEVHNTKRYNSELGMKRIIYELEKNGFVAFQSSAHWSSVFAVNKELVK